jgi:hypothetical protein
LFILCFETFRNMLDGKKELDIELVNTFYLYLETYSVHSNYKYKNKALFSVCDEEGNEYVHNLIHIILVKKLH